MGLLDDYTPPYTPPMTREGKKIFKQTALSQEVRDSELNNLGRDEMTEDFSDSPALDI